MVKSEPKSQHNDIILYSKCWIEQKEITILSWFIVNFFLWKKIIFPEILWIINLSFCELFIDHFNQRWSTHDFFYFIRSCNSKHNSLIANLLFHSVDPISLDLLQKNWRTIYQSGRIFGCFFFKKTKQYSLLFDK